MHTAVVTMPTPHSLIKQQLSTLNKQQKLLCIVHVSQKLRVHTSKVTRLFPCGHTVHVTYCVQLSIFK